MGRVEPARFEEATEGIGDQELFAERLADADLVTLRRRGTVDGGLLFLHVEDEIHGDARPAVTSTLSVRSSFRVEGEVSSATKDGRRPDGRRPTACWPPATRRSPSPPATTPARRPATAGQVAGGNALAGTRTLIRFALRRDRIRFPVWILALLLGTLMTANSFSTLYSDPQDRANAARSMGSPAGLAMSGPRHYLDDYAFGSMLAHQMLGFMAVLVGLMSVLIITRHTRAEEETGRAELVRSTVVGRHAHLAAALSVAVLANLALALLLAFGLAGLGMEGIDTAGSLLYGFGHAAVGLVFAAVSAVTVQLTAHTRGASGMALAVVGVAYVLRAAGDSGENAALSWLSPIGWVQRSYPYVDNRWWPLLLCLALAVACAAAGFALSTRRDVGAGLRPEKLGRPTASDALTTPLGFALRLHRGMLIGFGAGLFLMGAMYGSILGDAEDMLKDIDQIQEALDRIGGAGVAESFASMVMAVPRSWRRCTSSWRPCGPAPRRRPAVPNPS
ncbi:hypothetical protein SHIRM173S_07679 [Streptomyces hirsutus]